ncbi:hypothetical protein Dip518_000819 [Parelusimicrobium proximum]|uniref:hypothetical protein n=1 Tax=Parelusimicrobium proximum TaxID=3228953 RepID=UPI003D17E218
MKFKGIEILMGCPICGKGKIKAIESHIIKNKIEDFCCTDCSAQFVVDVRHEENMKKHFYFGRHSNPEYWNMDDIPAEEVLNTFKQRDEAGIRPYLGEYKMAEILYEVEPNDIT